MNSISSLLHRMHDQAGRIPQSLFAYNRNGLRMAIAAIEDETRELHDAWAAHKGLLDDGCAAGEIRHELLDIAAVAMLAYEETYRGKPAARESRPAMTMPDEGAAAERDRITSPEAIEAAADAILAAPYPKVGEGTARNFATLAIKAVADLLGEP